MTNVGAAELSNATMARTPQLKLPDYPRPQPCPDTTQCPPSGSTRRVFLIEGGKEDGAFAQTFYQIVVNGVLHAWREGMVPWVRFSPRRVAKTLGVDWWRGGPNGTGRLWETLFESYCSNVSAWVATCPNVKVQSGSVNFFYYTVGMAAPWAVHCEPTLALQRGHSNPARQKMRCVLTRPPNRVPSMGELELAAAAIVLERPAPGSGRPRQRHVRSL